MFIYYKLSIENSTTIYILRSTRDESVNIWLDRYETSQTGTVTKKFLPDKIVRTTRFTPLHIKCWQVAEYLHRFKLNDSSGCECDDNMSSIYIAP